jgi:hypothetical protein
VGLEWQVGCRPVFERQGVDHDIDPDILHVGPGPAGVKIKIKIQ